MSIFDLILFPFYVLLFSIFFSARRKKYNDPLLQKYHKQGFWIKVAGTVAFTIFNVYLSPGDSFGLYHNEGANIYHLILHDPSNIKWLFSKGENFDESLLQNIWNAGYFKAENNYLVTRMVAVISFFTFGKYMITNLVFSMIAFTGVWKLFLFFYEQYPHLHKKFAIAILYLPTFVFWSSGILKDTICIAALGWISFAIYEVFYRKRGILKNSIILFIFGYLLIILKVYILVSYVPFFILFIIMKNVQTISSKFIKFVLTPVIIVLSLIGFSKVLSSFGDELGQFAVKDLTKSIQTYNKAWDQQAGQGIGSSNFSLGVEYDGSLSGLVKLLPAATTATLFRPFLWETHKPSTVLSSLESMLMMLFTIYIIWKAKPIPFLRIIFKDPLITYCFLFSIVFALFVGATTRNFGTLVRYKIPCMPFYVIALYLIYEKVKEKAVSAKEAVIPQLNMQEGSLTLAI